jgi:hypothetical protein
MGPLYPFVDVKKSQDDLLIGLGGITTRASWGGAVGHWPLAGKSHLVQYDGL